MPFIGASLYLKAVAEGALPRQMELRCRPRTLTARYEIKGLVIMSSTNPKPASTRAA